MAGSASWAELFTKHDFFHRFRNYIQVVAMTRDPQVQIKWCVARFDVDSTLELTRCRRGGTVESRMRHFVMRLEYVDNLRLAHPFCKGFNSTVRCVSEEEASAVMRGQPPSAPDAESSEDDPANESAPHKVYLTSFFIGLAVRPKSRKHIYFLPLHVCSRVA